MIRPTTKVHDVLGDVIVRGYADGLTRDDIPADNWEPFVRTMPHSEYPSGSSCLCTAAAVALNKLLGDNGGDDDNLFVNTIGMPLTMKKIENSVVDDDSPSTNEIPYGSWTEIETICGQSRLWGGMHFSSAVPAGHDLCYPIGIRVYETITKLTTGIAPEFVMDVASVTNDNEQQQQQHPPVKEIRCPNDFDIDSDEEITDEEDNSESSAVSSTGETLQLLVLLLINCMLIAVGGQCFIN